MTCPTGEFRGRTGLCVWVPSYLASASLWRRWAMISSFPPARGSLQGLQCAACDRVSKSVQFRRGVLASASKLWIYILQGSFLFNRATDIFILSIHFLYQFFGWIQIQVGKMGLFMDLLKLHLSFGLLLFLFFYLFVWSKMVYNIIQVPL